VEEPCGGGQQMGVVEGQAPPSVQQREFFS
jgi:hypothetical protein